jgi:hypothetical protein
VARALGAARIVWFTSHDVNAQTLKQRTLTNLYNQRPTGLANFHNALDRAAYRWDDRDPASVPEDETLAQTLTINLKRSNQM